MQTVLINFNIRKRRLQYLDVREFQYIVIGYLKLDYV